jgi:hypothetical protein
MCSEKFKSLSVVVSSKYLRKEAKFNIVSTCLYAAYRTEVLKYVSQFQYLEVPQMVRPSVAAYLAKT